MGFVIQIIKIRFLLLWASLVFFFLTNYSQAQQILWAKLYPLPKEDQITCITQDTFGEMYVGGYSRNGEIFPGDRPRAMVYKLDSNGDTLFSLWTGIYGSVMAIQQNPLGQIWIAVEKRGFSSTNPSQTHILTMTPDGFIFKRDTIPNIIYINHSCLGKDSSWVLVGYTPNPLNGFIDDFYVQRIRKDGTIEPYITINDNFSGRAHRVEQLPDGKYLVSGSAGSLLISYTFDENLTNPQPMETWYQQGTGAGPISTGHVSRINNQRFMVGGQAGPCIVGQFDSLKQKYWMHKQIGSQIPPQAMTDGSIVFGYLTSVGPPNPFYRLGSDSNTIWFISIKDSLIARGINNAVDLKCFTFFEDQSAVVTGLVQNPATNRDPIFLKISNVGTPVTALSKPKRGTLSNETLAPWPNPSGGTLYLKQHFDKAEVHFYTVSGREVQTDTVRFGQPINISYFTPGLYLYRAVIDGKPFSGRVVRN